MRLLNLKKYLLLLSSLSILSCEEAYMPDFGVEDMQPVLIVEGFINTEGSSRFTLSQTAPLGSEGAVALVADASITIESSDGKSYTSTRSEGNGHYTINHPELSHSQEYRVRIKTSANEYASTFVKPQASPAITNIDWERTEDGTEIFVSTSNTAEGSNFYRWEFEEDWRYSSRFPSYFLVDGNEIRARRPEENISFCFKNARSSDVLIGSTESFVENRIDKQLVQKIPNLSEKIMYRYAILVKQYSISKEAYVYWSILKKNSESVGDIFGSMPSELKGNITNINKPSEHVIGMIEAGKSSQKRIYINALDFKPTWYSVISDYQGCTEGEVSVRESLSFFSLNPAMIVTYEVYKNEASPLPTHYAYSARNCVNCTVRGGSLTAPNFWLEKE